jgi:hypothetical protein
MKIKTYIFTLTLITLLIKLFKNYRSIRNILKVFNYVILALFGFSFFDAFGSGFISQFKSLIDNVIEISSQTTFYKFLMRIFNVTEENESIRGTYKKPVDVD